MDTKDDAIGKVVVVNKRVQKIVVVLKYLQLRGVPEKSVSTIYLQVLELLIGSFIVTS